MKRVTKKVSLKTFVQISCNATTLATITGWLLLTVGCGAKLLSWKEDVLLQSGEALVVQRSISFKEYQPAGGGGGSDVLDSTLEVVAPQRSDNPQRWSHPPLIPMLLDRDPESHEWLIVATFYMCTAWYDLGRPKLPYAEFRYRAGEWTQSPLSERLIGRSANLLVPNQADVDRDHTVATKREIMSNPTIAPQYKQIIGAWQTNC